MRNWFLTLIMILSFSAIYADGSPEKIETLSAKVILQNTNGYFVFSDGSCWKAVGFSKRWRSLSEWWNNVQLIPEHYECAPNDWYLGTQVAVYSKYGNLDISEANASNQEDLKQCTHLLVNMRTGQVLFAIALEPETCITQLFKDACQDGYNKGYSEGRLNSYKNAEEIYDKGHGDGYKEGYQDGYQAAFEGRPQAG